MKFAYRKFGIFWRPVIPVTFKYRDQTIEYHALLDTGADTSLIQAEVGEFLGINIKKGHQYLIHGVAGQAIGYLHRVEVIINGQSFGKVPINFSYKLPKDSLGILGHEGLFDQFELKFNFAQKEIEITS
jgi:predicted aspartyl protease